MRTPSPAVFLILLAFTPAHGADTAVGEAITPAEPPKARKLRELSTDRPDKTESPITVDKGHFQFETDVVSWVRDEEGGNTTNRYGFNIINLKAGIADDIDLQAVLENYVIQQSNERHSGYGDTTLRLKYNLFGNDGGFAVGLLPHVKIPTAAEGLGNGKVEGGLMVNAGGELRDGFYLGGTLQLNGGKNEGSDDHRFEVVSSIAPYVRLVGGLWGYVEFYNEVATEHGSPWVATVDAGLTYLVTPDVQLDLGANVGVTDAADDLNPFLGVSARI